MATPKQEQEQRDKLLSIDQTLKEVVIPGISALDKKVTTIADRDYITEEKADRKYALKEDVTFIKRVVYGVIMAIILGFIGLGFAVIQSRVVA